jgi:hypothetical protein
MSGDNFDDDIVQEIARWDAGFAPQAGRRPGLEALANGDHDLEIVEAELTRTEKTREAILRTVLHVLPAGGVYEHVYFFRTQDAYNRLGADVATLGFPLDAAQPFSGQLKGIVPRLRGVRFRARKGESKGTDGKVYHNLYINSRLAGAPMPAAGVPAGARAPETAGPGSDNDVPF